MICLLTHLLFPIDWDAKNSFKEEWYNYRDSSLSLRMTGTKKNSPNIKSGE